MNMVKLTPELASYLEKIESEAGEISSSRLDSLTELSKFVSGSLREGGVARLVFICTHNSRRSQFGQIWAETAARYYGIENILAYSGGTESTAFNTRAVAAIKRAGFIIREYEEKSPNPVYSVSTGKGSGETRMFSKRYDDPANPSENYCAIMVCSDADEACPSVKGASSRISLPYSDPKDFDGSGLEKIKYDERCREIAGEMFRMFRMVRGEI